MPGLFDKVVAAKPAAGGQYPKMGKYWFIIDEAKKGTHQTKTTEFMVFEGKVLYVLDPMEVDVPDSEKHENGRGRGPKAGEPMSMNFMDGVEGNEGRLKSFIMGAVACAEADVTKPMLELAVSVQQPMKDIVVEVFAGPLVTKKKKNIVASRVVRRIPASEVAKTMNASEKAAQLGNGRLERMLAFETAELAASVK